LNIFKAYTTKSLLSVHAHKVFNFLDRLVLEKNEVFACFFENSNSKICSESRIKFLFGLSFALCHSRLSEQFSGSREGYGTVFRDTGGYQKAGTSSLKRVTGRNFTIGLVIDFIEAIRNINLDFLRKKTIKNCECRKRSYIKNCFDV
jgi:hypothetical protein